MIINLTTLPLILAFLSIAPLAFAGENHTHDHGHGSHAEISIPQSLPELLKAITSEHATLATAIENKDIQTAHDAEQHIQAFIKAIPNKTYALQESARNRINGQAKNLARAYDSVHHASDDNNWKKAASALKKAEGSMKVLTAQLSKI